MCSELINSDGQGDLGPDGMTKRLGNRGDGSITDSGVRNPARTFERPAVALIPRVLQTDGCRRSASTSSTRLPSCAMTIAALMLVVLFPSCGSGLVTSMILGGA